MSSTLSTSASASSWLVRQISDKTKLRSSSSSYSLHSMSTATTAVSSVGSLCSSSTGTMTHVKSESSLERWKKSECSLDYWTTVNLDESSETAAAEVKPSSNVVSGDNAKKTDHFFERLVHDAPHMRVNLHMTEKLPPDPPFDLQQLPDWIDFTKLRDGRKFIHRHFFAIIFAHAVGLFLLVTVKPIQSLLLRTSNGIHARPEKAFTFFLKVFVQLVQWYKSMKYEVLTAGQENPDVKSVPNESKPVQPQQQQHGGFDAELVEIKTLIRIVNEKFKKFIPPLKHELELTTKEEIMFKSLKSEFHPAHVENVVQKQIKSMPPILVTMNPQLAFSQYHLAIIQYTFYGLVCRYPKLFGVHDKDDDHRGLDGFRHIWALLGHMLGLSDEYNCALQQLQCSSSAESEDSLLTKILLFSFSMIDETGLHMWRVISSGFTKYFMFMRTDVVIQFILKNLVNMQKQDDGGGGGGSNHNAAATTEENNNSSSQNINIHEEKSFWSNMSFMHKLYYLIYCLILKFLLRFSLFRVGLNKCTELMIRYANYCYRRNRDRNRNNAKSRSSSIFARARSLNRSDNEAETV